MLRVWEVVTLEFPCLDNKYVAKEGALCIAADSLDDAFTKSLVWFGDNSIHVNDWEIIAIKLVQDSVIDGRKILPPGVLG